MRSVISDIEVKFTQRGLVRDYSDAPASKSKTIAVQLLNGDYVGDRFYFPQDSTLDKSTIRAIEFLDNTSVSHWLIDGQSVEGVTPGMSQNMTFTISNNSDDKISVPLTVTNRNNNNGKFCFIQSAPYNHLWGDCFIDDFGKSGAGRVLAIRVYYD